MQACQTPHVHMAQKRKPPTGFHVSTEKNYFLVECLQNAQVYNALSLWFRDERREEMTQKMTYTQLYFLTFTHLI